MILTISLLGDAGTVPKQYWLFKQETHISLGRGADNNIVLSDRIVSRRHLELKKTEHGWQLMNLGVNGTYVNDVLIDSYFLRGAEIIGLTSLDPRLLVQLSSVPFATLVKATNRHHSPLLSLS
ncbi:MAG: FHA domain-containing protein [Chloroflexaceae bacterium]|nr:FHA domain-containing protein [Chloroflexaceae bacterium]